MANKLDKNDFTRDCISWNLWVSIHEGETLRGKLLVHKSQDIVTVVRNYLADWADGKPVVVTHVRLEGPSPSSVRFLRSYELNLPNFFPLHSDHSSF
jgi:hypothetical protein